MKQSVTSTETYATYRKEVVKAVPEAERLINTLMEAVRLNATIQCSWILERRDDWAEALAHVLGVIASRLDVALQDAVINRHDLLNKVHVIRANMELLLEEGSSDLARMDIISQELLQRHLDAMTGK